MNVAIVAAVLASLVLGVFWLISQEWLGLSPKPVKRVVGAGGLITLVMVSQLAPSAFQDGLSQFSEWSQRRMMERYQDLIDAIIANQPDLPRQSAPPNPAMGEMQPIP